MNSNWYCIYTKFHHEDDVSRQLINLHDIEILNPKLKARKFIRGSLSDTVEKLFPCYIFSKFNLKRHYHIIRYTRGVRRIIGDGSKNPYVVDESIIACIKSRIKDGFIHMDPPTLNPGDRVIIQAGLLKGFMGIFQKELKAQDRVMILLNTIAYQASIEIEKGLLAKV